MSVLFCLKSPSLFFYFFQDPCLSCFPTLLELFAVAGCLACLGRALQHLQNLVRQIADRNVFNSQIQLAKLSHNSTFNERLFLEFYQRGDFV